MARRILCPLLHTALTICGPVAIGQPWPRVTMDFDAPAVVLSTPGKVAIGGFFPPPGCGLRSVNILTRLGNK
jgi:hypothetical protein